MRNEIDVQQEVIFPEARASTSTNAALQPIDGALAVADEVEAALDILRNLRLTENS